MYKIFAIIIILITVFLCACTPTPTQNQTPTPPASQQPGEVTPTPYLVADPTPEAVEPKQMYVTGSNVNVRSEANTTSSVLTALKRNTPVTVYRQENGWYYIEYAENKFGYMSAQYLSDEKYIATAEEQLKLMAEFDLYKNMPEYLDLISSERFFAVTDLNQNGRLEIVLVSENMLRGGILTNVNIYEIDENYATLKKYNELRYSDKVSQFEPYWPDITFGLKELYIKDNQYYYVTRETTWEYGADETGEWVEYIYLDDYTPLKKELVGSHPSKNINEDGSVWFEMSYYTIDADHHVDLTKEEYDAVANDPIPGATKKTVSIHWELVETESVHEKPLYNYKKATPAQRLIALKKSYEGFVIK